MIPAPVNWFIFDSLIILYAVKISMEIFRTELNNDMLYSKFDAFVNKVLGESLQGGKISSIPAAMRGVGTTSSNVPPSTQPQITSAQTMPKAPQTKIVPSPITVQTTTTTTAKDQEIKNEISKLPQDVQQKIASAKSVDEITAAISNVDPTSKQKIEDYMKTYAAGIQAPQASPTAQIPTTA